MLFVLVLVGHLILISAQVQSRSGVPVLEAVTFGVFSRVQLAFAAVVDFGRNGWGNYVGLRGARAENEALKRQLADLEVRLQEQRALAARTQQLQQLLDLQQSTALPTLAAEVIAGNPNPGHPDRDRQSRQQRRRADRHGGHLAEGHRRPGGRAVRRRMPRACSC